MLLESDVLVAHLKKTDWLKDAATQIFGGLHEGTLRAEASSEVLHELVYVFQDIAPLSILKSNIAKLATTPNLIFIRPSCETYIMAVHLSETYGISSIFDAIHAATALGVEVPDHTVISTDNIYDRVPGLRRIDPRSLCMEEDSQKS